MLYEILAFVAVGAVLATALWTVPVGLFRVSGSAALLLAFYLAGLAVTGWPLFRVRLHQRPAPAAHASSHQMHSSAGHMSVWPVSIAAPLLFAAALRRPGSRWRRATHLAAACLVVAGWFIVSVTGYFLPDHLPDPLPPHLAPVVLRFAVLHMLGVPALVFIALAVIGWRHLRLARRMGAVELQGR